MFTGLIEEIGTIRQLQRQGDALIMTISAPLITKNVATGDSIAINGVCLTVTRFEHDYFTATAVEETVSKTALKQLHIGSSVNLERALRLSDRLGGHLVAGHVDDVGHVVSIQPRPHSWLIEIEVHAKWMRYIIDQGSVAVDGISLTVASQKPSRFTVSIIPETWQRTTLNQLRVGQLVNIEVDLIGKYVEKLVTGQKDSNVTLARLSELGY